VSRRLVLFDIDSTLLSAGGVTARSFEAALREVFGTVGDAARFDYSGKTDPQIVRELMQGAGFSDAEIEERRPLALSRYRERLAASIRPEHVQAKPGVSTLLEALESHSIVTLGLLTGNLEPTARLKLAPLDANRFFAFGAFGSDDEDRYRLPAIALERAREAVGLSFEGPDVVIVGDSVHDVLCGRGLGVRAVAVATGKTSPERLAEVAPDALLADFSDTGASVSAILDGS
jgi:phosphoglycolate phosphatase-like HAD superfamily hydrolase